jgi:hypothetical protein
LTSSKHPPHRQMDTSSVSTWKEGRLDHIRLGGQNHMLTDKEALLVEQGILAWFDGACEPINPGALPRAELCRPLGLLTGCKRNADLTLKVRGFCRRSGSTRRPTKQVCGTPPF